MRRTATILCAVALPVSAVGAASALGATREHATCALTPQQTEGPYYTANPPRRANIIAGASGRRLVVSGRVVDASCRPIANARVDFWQADGNGEYDNDGYRLRGWHRTDAKGRYRLVTVVPGLYPGRTEHIHVKVTAPGGPTVTSQLYFPGVANNGSDGIFDPATLVKLNTKATPWQATFRFVVPRR